MSDKPAAYSRSAISPLTLTVSCSRHSAVTEQSHHVTAESQPSRAGQSAARRGSQNLPVLAISTFASGAHFLRGDEMASRVVSRKSIVFDPGDPHGVPVMGL